MSGRVGLDADDVVEALLDATPIRQQRGKFTTPAVARDEDVRDVARQIRRFLEELPGEVSVSELRDVLDEALPRQP